MATRYRFGIAMVGLACLLVVCCEGASAEWRKVRPVTGNEDHSFLVLLKQRNVPLLRETLHKVSTPGSVAYRRYLSKDEVTSLVGPDPTVINSVMRWLSAHGLFGRVTGNRDFIRVNGKVSAIAQAFGVELSTFHVHKLGARAAELVRATKSLTPPAEVAPHIDMFSRLSVKEPGAPHPLRSYRHKAEGAAAASNSGMPDVRMIYSSESTVFPEFAVTCLTSSSTNDATNPCNDHGAAVEYFSIRVKDQSGAVHAVYNVSVADSRCQLMAGMGVSCISNAGGDLPSYQLWSVEVASAFAGGIVSPYNDFYGVRIVTSDFVTPQLLQQQYSIPTGMSGNYSYGAYANSQSVAEFVGQFYSPSDLSTFFLKTGVPSVNVSVVGPNNASQPGDEASLDIQWIMAVGQQVPTVFWSLGDNKYLLEWAEELSSSSAPPLVNSISYSDNEADSLPQFMDRVDVELMKLGVRGVSVIVAAGDAGATNIGHGSSNCSFAPQYPASSPYATSVSATMLTPVAEPVCDSDFGGARVNCKHPLLEAAVAADNGMVWTTGGGFSHRYRRPSYQSAVVNRYLRTAQLPPTSMFNSSNRGYPDVSAIGHNLIVYDNGKLTLADGTSASTPIFAGVIALLNGLSLANDQPPLGFLNPLLYAMQEQQRAAFFDVTVGNNRCGDVLHPPHVACCKNGYYAANGWDAVTGLGTPNYAVLADIVSRL